MCKATREACNSGKSLALDVFVEHGAVNEFAVREMTVRPQATRARQPLDQQAQQYRRLVE
jgi:hypothetical protein